MYCFKYGNHTFQIAQSWDATIANADAREAAMYTELVHLVTTLKKRTYAVVPHLDDLSHFFG
jgi:hypothetical protein